MTIVCLGDSVTGVYYHTGGRRAYPEMLEVAIKQVIPKAKMNVTEGGGRNARATAALAFCQEPLEVSLSLGFGIGSGAAMVFMDV